MVCKHCKSLCIKAGLSRNRLQRYQCKACRRYQQARYKYEACYANADQSIIKLLTEGLAIRGIARFLRISATTVISRIKSIATKLNKTYASNLPGVYEIDEMWTYIGSKQRDTWITYAIDRETKEVINFVVGPRSRERLSIVTASALALCPAKICTDGLPTYKTLIPTTIHRVGLPHTRRIERFNLTLRTHLKRLNRKTICFSKSLSMLENCLKIYFWGVKRDFYKKISAFHVPGVTS
jgi:insertion element IS1 protein InsB